MENLPACLSTADKDLITMIRKGEYTPAVTRHVDVAIHHLDLVHQQCWQAHDLHSAWLVVRAIEAAIQVRNNLLYLDGR